ncbi:MAG: DUF3488 and transglutaminase-like domain-containing protein [Burkholderiaceae bacterium]|nr:DUF3488 and transglutaminase-like domain-containing protein [Burkholderiaceae bacterium]
MPRPLRYSLRALGGAMGAQWERERRETLFLMLPVLVSVLPHLPYLPAWAGVAFVVLFVWRFALVLSGRWLPRAFVRWVAALGCCAAVYAQYGTLLGREPGVVLLVLFLGVKLMEMQARRDLFVVIFLCFFLLLTAFFHSQSIATAAVVLVALYGLLAAMLTMQYRRAEASIGARLKLVGSMLAQALPLALVAFLLFPRAGGPLWGASTDEGRATTGLSDSMTVGNIARLGESDAIVFRVRFDGTPPPNALLYWRGPVFGDFDGRTWRALASPRGLGAPRIEYANDPTHRFAYEVTLEASGRDWLFALEMPLEADAGHHGAALRLPDLQLVATRPLHERIRYRVVSQTVFRIGADERDESLRPWLALPPGFAPRAVELASRWRRSGDAPQALVARALAMFREQSFRYTLEPPRLGVDSVDEFLFETRAGFCEHYASAFVVLMRAMAIPARIVTGYQGGERNPIDGYWLVRQADAHAWAEVWLAGLGWVRVDPTAAVDPARIEQGRRLAGRTPAGVAGTNASPWPLRIRSGLEAIGNAWNQFVLQYDGARQQSLLSRFGIDAGKRMRLAALLAVVLGATIVATALITLRPRSVRTPLQRCWDEFCARLAAIGLGRMMHETPSRYLARIERALDDESLARARRIVATYERLRYAVAEPEREAVRNLRLAVQAFQP